MRRRLRPTPIAAPLLAFLLCGLAALPARADFYRCRDGSGQITYANRKLPGMRCRLVWKTRGSSSRKKERSGAAARARSSSSSRRDLRHYEPPGVAGDGRPADTAKLRERIALYMPYVEEAAERYRLPAEMIKAVIRVESRFDYRAESAAGAQGLMQLMPATARSMGVDDPWDPRQNIMGGARYLRVLANRYEGDIVKVLSAYNAGSGAVARKGGIPYSGTEGYVRAVLDHYYRYKAGLD